MANYKSLEKNMRIPSDADKSEKKQYSQIKSRMFQFTKMKKGKRK